ncbi:glycosyltransferase family 4 protein [Flavobacterium sp. LaA7.5]|nr:glycosyltransferase family 4 protein [Flavobacterium salilacus subsp. altitudinum]
MGNKVLFVHDGPLQKDHDGNYYGVDFGNVLKERFLYLGSHVTFMMRTKYISSEDLKKYSTISNDNFDVIDVPDFKSIGKYFKNIKPAKEIIREAVASHDIIVCRLPSAIGSIAATVALELKKPLMAEYVACTYDAYWNYSWKGKLIAHYKMWTQKVLVKKVPYIIYVTKHFLQNRYPSPAIQTNCSNVEIINMYEQDLEERLKNIENTNNNQSPLILGTVAAINVIYKGHEDVFRALKILKQKGIAVKYKLVGNGSPSRLEALAKELDIEDYIEIIGPVKHSEVFEFYKKIDIYIQPSKQEGLPRAVIEAMSRACPVLGSRIAGIPELLNEDKMFKPGNAEEIAEKIMKFDKTEMQKEAKYNFEKAKQYKKDVLMYRRLNFYKNFLEQNHIEIPEILSNSELIN